MEMYDERYDHPGFWPRGWSQEMWLLVPSAARGMRLMHRQLHRQMGETSPEQLQRTIGSNLRLLIFSSVRLEPRNRLETARVSLSRWW